LRDFEGETTGTVAEFLKAYAGLWGSTVLKSGTPWSRVEAWENLVADCEEGYEQNTDELHWDGQCRLSLEKAMSAPELDAFPEQMQALRERVLAADERLRLLFLPGVQIGHSGWEWWRRGVLRNGAGEYADDMLNYYGIDLRNQR
jgi:hypothetical protein